MEKPAQIRPTVEDLIDHAETSYWRRGLTRYLVPRNPEASVRRHKRLGTPSVRKAIMATMGRRAVHTQAFNEDSGYRLHMKSDGKVEGALDFAFSRSVVNELIHLGATIVCTSTTLNGIREGLEPMSPLSLACGVAIAINVVPIPVQRYNRARIVSFANRCMQRGYELDADYTNMLGIDGQAFARFRQAQDMIQVAEVPLPEEE